LPDAYQLEPERGMGLLTRTTLVALLAAPAPAAQAQDYAPAPPISSADMINYCVYGGLIYSVGSQICVMKGSPPLYCDQPAGPAQPAGIPRPRASWTTSQPPATINCPAVALAGSSSPQAPSQQAIGVVHQRARSGARFPGSGDEFHDLALLVILPVKPFSREIRIAGSRGKNDRANARP
jgi:hypothetical protein